MVTPYLNKSYSDKDRWATVFPAYINSKKTVYEGRRVPKAKAVENPTYQEIRDVLQAANFAVSVEEHKIYPRERSKEMLYRGKISVHMKNDDGTPKHPTYTNKKLMLNYLCENIPRLKTRAQKS